MKKQLCLTATILLLVSNFNAQDNDLGNSNLSPVFLNPSFAGSNGLFRATSSYAGFTKLTTGFETGYQKLTTSADGYIDAVNGGVALTYLGQSYGPLDNQQVTFAYAQHLKFPEKHLIVIPSLQLGYSQKSISSDWIVPPNTLIRNTVQYASINSGLLINYRKNFFAGMILENLNHPDAGFVGLNRLPLHFSFHSSYTFNLADNSLLQVMAKAKQTPSASALQLSANAIIHQYLIIGAGYSDSESFQVVLGGRTNNFAAQLAYNGYFSAGLNYDSVEFHISYNLRKKEIRKDVPLFERM